MQKIQKGKEYELFCPQHCKNNNYNKTMKKKIPDILNISFLSSAHFEHSTLDQTSDVKTSPQVLQSLFPTAAIFKSICDIKGMFLIVHIFKSNHILPDSRVVTSMLLHHKSQWNGYSLKKV